MKRDNVLLQTKQSRMTERINTDSKNDPMCKTGHNMWK